MKIKILRLFFYSIVLLSCCFNCQKEDFDNVNQTKPLVSIKKQSLPQSKHYKNLKTSLNNLESKGQFSLQNYNTTLGRNSEDFFTAYTIDTTNVKYLEAPISHSYIFPVYSSESNTALVSNLVLAKHNQMEDYISLLITYQLTEEEIQLISTGETPTEYTNTPVVENLDINPSDLNIGNRSTCVTYETITFLVPCSHADHQEDHETAACTHPDQQSITVSIYQDCSGGGGSSGNTSGGSPSNPGTDSPGGGNPGGGGSGINWGDPGNSPYNSNNNDDTQDLLADGPLTQINPVRRSAVRLEMPELLDLHDVNFLNSYPNIETGFNYHILQEQSSPESYGFVDWSIDYLQHLHVTSHSQVPGLPPTQPENEVIFDGIVNTYLSNEEIIEELEQDYFEDYINSNQEIIQELEWFEEVIPSSTQVDRMMNCFNNVRENLSDSSSFSVTIYVEQPIPNSDAPNDGTNPGHTFVSMSTNDPVNSANNITQTFGFYPANSVNPVIGNNTSAGEFHDNSNSPYDVSATISLNESDFYGLVSQVSTLGNSIPEYNLETNNCTDVGINLANSINMNLPDTSGTWGIDVPLIGFKPLGSGSNPGALGQDIRNLNNPNVTVSITPGSGPVSSGECD